MADPLGYAETVFEYYLPGVDHQSLTDEEFAQKYANLEYLRTQEILESIELAKLGLVTKRKK
ncbi:hypothetical protein CJD36_019850 [Flavipsychrobacter stenotrophus]|uniref:Uncharacterized protein n=1 Tax=Flavipsychrobacter stenotrophus TaxID=2077091 RepID=A0A2S7SSH9_9BACT|nr:hypothetical protein [Flavipsychrobacter stenotrophus]PQJ09496.1 hypothetical protein CJD36_019850 [Flavipsychrobacter stenotrophus]